MHGLSTSVANFSISVYYIMKTIDKSSAYDLLAVMWASFGSAKQLSDKLIFSLYLVALNNFHRRSFFYR
jgi:hypothetical protein